eukprot:6552847-Prymnesium_polylepis.1
MGLFTNRRPSPRHVASKAVGAEMALRSSILAENGRASVGFQAHWGVGVPYISTLYRALTIERCGWYTAL